MIENKGKVKERKMTAVKGKNIMLRFVFEMFPLFSVHANFFSTDIQIFYFLLQKTISA